MTTAIPTQMNLKHIAELRVEEAYLKAEEHYGRTFKRVPIYWSDKMTRTAGYARFHAWNKTPIEIQLSSTLLKLNGPQFVDTTPGHEAAHLIALELYGDVGHGPEWKEVMRVIGQDPKRCHSMTVPKKANGVTYHCNCQEFDFTRQRHNKIERGAKYTCRKCKAYIVKGKLTAEEPKKAALTPTKTEYKEVTVNSDHCKTNADKVRLIIKHTKANSGDMDTIIMQAEQLAVQLNMKLSLFKTYVKNNWSKV